MVDHTPDDHPQLRANRQLAEKTGQRVEDLRDDGRWHDVTHSPAGKGDDRRPRQISDAEYARRFAKAFSKEVRCTCQWCNYENPCWEECIDACAVHGSTE